MTSHVTIDGVTYRIVHVGHSISLSDIAGSVSYVAVLGRLNAQALQPDGKLVVAGYGRRPVDGGDQDLLDLARYACP